jgi:hypothetical protein
MGRKIAGLSQIHCKRIEHPHDAPEFIRGCLTKNNVIVYYVALFLGCIGYHDADIRTIQVGGHIDNDVDRISYDKLKMYRRYITVFHVSCMNISS